MHRTIKAGRSKLCTSEKEYIFNVMIFQHLAIKKSVSCQSVNRQWTRDSTPMAKGASMRYVIVTQLYTQNKEHPCPTRLIAMEDWLGAEGKSKYCRRLKNVAIIAFPHYNSGLVIRHAETLSKRNMGVNIFPSNNTKTILTRGKSLFQ